MNDSSANLLEKDGAYYRSGSTWVSLEQPIPPIPIFSGSFGSYLFVTPDPDVLDLDYKGASAKLHVDVPRPTFLLIESEDPEVKLTIVGMVRTHHLRKATVDLKGLDTDVLDVAREPTNKRRCLTVKRDLDNGEYLLVGFHSRYRQNNLQGETIIAYAFEFAVKAKKNPH